MNTTTTGRAPLDLDHLSDLMRLHGSLPVELHPALLAELRRCREALRAIDREVHDNMRATNPPEQAFIIPAWVVLNVSKRLRALLLPPDQAETPR